MAVKVTFTDSVDVTGMPQLDIDVGGSAKTLTYSSGTGTPALVFKGYVVAENDVDVDGIEIAEDALGLNGGTIRRKGSTVDATITHAAVAPESTHRVDGVRPALEGAATSTDGTGIVLTFSEELSATTAAVGAFAVTVNGATASLSGTPTVSGTTVTLTPASAVATGDTVTVAYTDPTTGNDANAVQDAAGNDAATFEAQEVTNTVDLVAPTYVSAATSADGKKVLLTFSEALSATTATATDFAVTVNGSAHGVSSVFAGGPFPAGPTVTLVLASAVTSGQTVTVAYSDPTGDDDGDAVQDVAGNDAASFSAQMVTNNVQPVTEGVELWTTTLTVGTFTSTVEGGEASLVGYIAAFIGSISGSAEFSYGGTTYAVEDISVSGGSFGGFPLPPTVGLGISSVFPAAPNDLLILALDGTEFRLDEATPVTDPPGYNWDNHGLTWSDGEPVAVQLIAVPPPMVASVALSDAGADGAYGIGDSVSVTVTFTDSVDVTGMPQLDIDVGGSAKTLTYDSGTGTEALVFKEYVVAENDVDDDGIQIAEDALGLNGGTILQKGSTTVATITHAAVAPESTHRVDGVRPALESAATSTDGTGIVLTFSEELSSTTAPASAFAVTVNGATASLSGTPAVSGTTVTLTPASAVATGDTVTVAYTDPSADNDANAVQDAAGNDAATFEAQAVTNNVDLVAPTFVSAATSADGRKVQLTFSEALSATTAPTNAFTVTVDGSMRGVSSVFAGGLFAARPTVTLVLESAVTAGQTVMVAYTDPTGVDDGDAVQDVAGNDAATFPAQTVTNSVQPGTEGEVLWTVEMTVGTDTILSQEGLLAAFTGWSAEGNGNVSGSAQFSYEGAAYTAEYITFNELVVGGVPQPDQLALIMSPLFPAAPDDLLILALDGTEFRIDEATRSTTDTPQYKWDSPGLTWSDGEPVAVKLIAVSGPQVASVEVVDPPSDNTYAIADTIDLAVTFTKDLTLDVTGGTPELELTVGNSTRTATCATATGKQLTCRHVVAEGIAGAIVVAANRLTLNGATLVGPNELNADTTYTAGVVNIDADLRVDGVRPAFVSAATSTDGATVELTFSEDLLTGSGNTPAAERFTVMVGTTAATLDGAPAVSGPRVTLTLATAVTSGKTVTVAYTDLSTADDAAVVQDLAGNDAETFPAQPVTNEVPSTDARLSALTLSGATLAPTFHTDSLNYTATVANLVASTTVEATPEHTSATVAYLDASDQALVDADDNAVGFQVALAEGANTIKVKVTAQDEVTQKTYTAVVTRRGMLVLEVDAIAGDDVVNIAEKAAGFPVTGNTGTESGVSVSVTIGTQSPLTATSDADGTWSVSVPAAASYIAGTSVSVTVSASKTGFGSPADVTRALAVDLSAPTLVSAATSADGTQIVLTFSEDLLATSGNTPARARFIVMVASSADTLTGSPTVSGTAVTLTLATAVTAGQTVTVAYTDLSTADDAAVVQDLAGNDAATFAAQSVTNEVPSTDASLSALTLTGVTLTPSFHRDSLSYTGSVANSVAMTTLSATKSHASAAIQYLDASDQALVDADASTPGLQVALEVGASTIKVRVTAEDGVTRKTYTVVVTRQASTDASLSALTLTGVTLTPSFHPDSTSYTGSAPHSVAMTTLSAAANHDSATVAYLDGSDQALVDAGAAAGFQVALEVGANTIKVRVTAEDGVTRKTYAMVVTRQVMEATGVTLSVSPDEVGEGAGQTALTVTGTLNGGAFTEDRTVALSVSPETASASDFTADAATLTIVAGQTSGTATLSLTPVADSVDEDDETVMVEGTASGLAVTGATVTITDDDTRGVRVSETSVEFGEGGSGSYTVVLESQPTATVTVGVSVAGDADVTVSPPSLEFTAGDWHEARTVTVSAGQDADADDDAATVSHAVSGGDYGDHGVTADPVAVAVTDDDEPSTGVTLTVSPSRVREGAGQTTLSVTGTLNGVAFAEDKAVSLSVSAGTAAGSDFTAGTATLTIEAGQTTGTATLPLTPVDDDVDEDDETVMVTGTVSGLIVTGAAVTIRDDDTRGVRVSETVLSIDEGGSGAYTVVLESQPTAAVTIGVSVSGDPDVTASPPTLEFTVGDWHEPRTVTVSAAQDEDADGDEATVSHAVSGGDYGSVTAPSVTVRVDDDDIDLEFRALATRLHEGDETALWVYTNGVTFETDQTITLTLGGTAASGTDYTLSEPNITIEAGSTGGGVTLAALEDSESEDDETITIAAHHGTSAIGTVTVTIVDGTVTATVPDAPVGLLAVPGSGEVALSWIAPSGQAGSDPYNGGSPVIRHEVRLDGGSWRSIPNSGEGGANEEAYTVTGLENDREYAFRVRAVNAVGPGAPSREVRATPSDGICGRTPQVRDFILVRLNGATGCGGVTAEDLASIDEGIYVNHSDIASLKAGDFDGLTAVPEVDLSGNRISSLPSGLFDDLGALAWLDLSGNRLSSLPAGIFDELALLSELDIDDNGLRSLRTGVFAGLAALEELNLRDNELTSFPYEEINELAGLRRLRLSGNPVYVHGVVVSKTALTIAPGGSGTYRMRLNHHPPTGAAIEPKPEGAGVSASPPSVPYGRTDWFRYKEVTVTVAQNATASSAEIKHKAVNYGPPGMATPTVTITIPQSAGDVAGAAGTGVAERDAAERDSLLALLVGLTPEQASEALFGERTLPGAQLDALDRLGNRNGRYDLGDLLSWTERCRSGEADCGNDPLGPGGASLGLLFGAPAAGRRRRSGRVRRQGSGRRRARGSLLAVLLAVTTWSCTGDLAGPPAAEREPVPPPAPATAPQGPGFLTIEWAGPAASREIGVLLELEGPGIEAVQAPGLELYHSGADGRHRIVVAGDLGAGALLRFRVPDRSRLSLYRVRVLQVTGEDYGLRDLGGYRAVIAHKPTS